MFQLTSVSMYVPVSVNIWTEVDVLGSAHSNLQNSSSNRKSSGSKTSAQMGQRGSAEPPLLLLPLPLLLITKLLV